MEFSDEENVDHPGPSALANRGGKHAAAGGWLISPWRGGACLLPRIGGIDPLPSFDQFFYGLLLPENRSDAQYDLVIGSCSARLDVRGHCADGAAPTSASALDEDSLPTITGPSRQQLIRVVALNDSTYDATQRSSCCRTRPDWPRSRQRFLRSRQHRAWVPRPTPPLFRPLSRREPHRLARHGRSEQIQRVT